LPFSFVLRRKRYPAGQWRSPPVIPLLSETAVAEVVIFGAGDLAEVVHTEMRSDREHEVVGFTVDRQYRTRTSFRGLPLIPFDEVADFWPPDRYRMLVALGYTDLNRARRGKCEQARALGYRLASFVHSSTVRFEGTAIGENTIILDGNSIQPHAVIGDNVLIWSRNAIGHHSTIGNHCCITSGVFVGGRTRVGEHSFLGIGCIVRDNIGVGAYSVIGAGCVVLADAPERSVFRAVEAKPSRVTSDRLRHL
jgi:sugar O-acyltransferase (sialic acid O-acetyltransferase NeuD family)